MTGSFHLKRAKGGELLLGEGEIAKAGRAAKGPIRERIARIYGREAVVSYPPVAVDDFSPDQPREDFYLLVSQFTPYKRIDLAVEAFRRHGARLLVTGVGPEMATLRRSAPANAASLRARRRRPAHRSSP